MNVNYTNPIIKGFYPDPSICKAKGKYYLVTSSFEYFPGVPIFVSEDLVNWEQIGHVLDRPSQLNLKRSAKSKGIFAPTIRYNDGTFYMVTTNVTTGENFIVTTKDPYKGWSDPVVIQGWSGIDPSLYFENGRIYLQGNSYLSDETLGIYQCELDPVSFKAITDRVMICKGTGGKAPEAPHVFKKDEYYYLVAAEGGTEYGHMVTLFRSKDINGPYESAPNNPILTNRSTKNLLQCVGHADFIEDFDGNWWLVALGVRSKGSHAYYHHLGREVMLSPVTWTKDDWVMVGKDGAMHVEMEGPLTTSQSKSSHDLVIDFQQHSNDLVYIREYDPNDYVASNDGLYLVGSSHTLNTTDKVSFVGLRQREFDVEFLVNFKVIEDIENFGISAYMSHDFHYDIQAYPNLNEIHLIKRIGSINYSAKVIRVENFNNISLKITSDETYYYFTVIENGQENQLGKGECAFIATELSATFTGVILGAYAYSNNHKKVLIENMTYKEL